MRNDSGRCFIAGAFALLAVGVVGLTPGVARAQIIVSTFNANDEGWRVGELTDGSGSTVPTFVATGGNPGGFIRTTDLFGFNAFKAPTAFLGNKSAYVGGSLSLDLRVASSDSIGYQVLRLLGGGGAPNLDYYAVTGPTFPANNVFTTFTIPLSAGAGSGWRLADQTLTDPAASPAQLAATLGNLSALMIDADWQSGSDQVDLDNVILSPGGGGAAAPEPGSLALLALAGVPVVGLLRRNRGTSSPKR